VAASSLGDLHAEVPAPAAAAIVVSCGCMGMHSLYRLSFELVFVWTCMNYQCLYGLVSTTFGLVCIAIFAFGLLWIECDANCDI